MPRTLLLNDTDHRPFPLPTGRWSYYQEWNDALFLHWKVPHAVLRQLVPERLEIDTHEGEAWISLVAFTMERIHPRGLPAVKCISDFPEVNVRTYVRHQGDGGVYFLSIEAGKRLSAALARWLSRMPYEKAQVERKGGLYQVRNDRTGFYLKAEYEIQAPLAHKTPLDLWLTERYCVFLELDGRICRYDVHHPEWPVHEAALRHLDLHYAFGDISLTPHPDRVHYSPGVQVLSWSRIGSSQDMIDG